MAEYTTSELLKLTESLYLKEEYSEVVTLLNKNKDLLETNHWHYNLGSAYLKNGQLGWARYHLEKVDGSSSFYTMASHNISAIKNEKDVVDLSKYSTPKELIIGKGLDLSIWFYASISAVLLFFTLLMFYKKIFEKRTLVLLLMLILIPLGFKFYTDNKYKEAIIIDQVFLREGPSDIYEENAVVAPGSKILFTKEKNKWLFITYPIRFRGWVDGKKMKIL